MMLGVLEKLEPIVFNPSYDFNYQQFMYLPREVTILPVRPIVIACTEVSLCGNIFESFNSGVEINLAGGEGVYTVHRIFPFAQSSLHGKLKSELCRCALSIERQGCIGE